MKWISSLLTACAGTLACAIVALPISAAAQPKPQIALYAMDCGMFFFHDTDVFADNGSFKGVSRQMVNPCYLVRHGSDYLLWDLGMPDGLAVSRKRLAPHPIVNFAMSKTLVSQLAELRLKPADIRFIALSHSHFDHMGNGGLFEGATLLVDEREHAFMFRAEARKEALGIAELAQELADAYGVLEKLKAVKIPHAEPFDVFGDGSVTMHPAPGHTPGHRVLLVRLPQAGPVLLTGDMYHLAESRANRTVPRRNNRAETLASMDMVEKLAAETGARVIRQHVADDFFSMPGFPEGMH